MLCAAAALWPPAARAQDLEPRQYSNIPTGMNFLLAGYVDSSGGVSVDPSLPLENAKLRTDGPIVGYARSLSIGGLSAKVDAGIARACLSGSADFEGQRVTRDVCGLTDAKTRVSMNFIGAPALGRGEFAGYRQNLIAGASLQVGVPVGDYDPSRIINIGSNRWWVKAEIGLSKALPRSWILEFALSDTIYADNDEYLNNHTRTQDPIYALQVHAIRNLRSGVWISVDSTHYRGGRTATDGIESAERLSNSRLGLTVSLPLKARQSIKLYYSSGVSTRFGTDFDTLGAAWQYRWGGGP